MGIVPVTLYQYYLGKFPHTYSILMNLGTLLSLLILVNISFLYKYNKTNIYDLFIYFIMFYMLIIINFDYLSYEGSAYLYKENMTILIRSFSMYLIGRTFLIDSKNKVIIIVFTFILLVTEKLINLDNTFLRLFFELEEGNGVYLFLGDTFAIVSILLISFIKSKSLRFLVGIIALVTLFAISSRSSMYIFLVVLFIMMIKENKFLHNIFFVLIFFLLFYLSISYFEINVVNNRMLNVISNVALDQSAIARNYLLEKGMRDISDYWFIGNYGSQYYNQNSFGSYIHNIFSFYRQYGLTVFIFILVIFLFISKYYYFWIKNKYVTNINYIFYISAFCFLEILLTRSYNTLHFWFAVGLFANKHQFILIKSYKKVNL
jgi:hypothetical protein